MLEGCRYVAALLFFPGSRPLHVQLLSLIHSTPDAAAVHQRMLEWVAGLGTAAGQRTDALPASLPAYLTVALPQGPRCPMASVTGALLSIQPLKDAAARQTMHLLGPLTHWLRSMVNTTAVNAEAQEQCQDVVKVLLVLLQTARKQGGRGVTSHDVCAVVDVACDALRAAWLVREGLHMLGSVLWESSALPSSTPAAGAALLASVLQPHTSDALQGRLNTWSHVRHAYMSTVPLVGWGNEHLAARGSSVAKELAACDPLARMHALQGTAW